MTEDLGEREKDRLEAVNRGLDKAATRILREDAGLQDWVACVARGERSSLLVFGPAWPAKEDAVGQLVGDLVHAGVERESIAGPHFSPILSCRCGNRGYEGELGLETEVVLVNDADYSDMHWSHDVTGGDDFDPPPVRWDDDPWYKVHSLHGRTEFALFIAVLLASSRRSVLLTVRSELTVRRAFDFEPELAEKVLALPSITLDVPRPHHRLSW